MEIGRVSRRLRKKGATPTKVGVHGSVARWIPAFAGMEIGRVSRRLRKKGATLTKVGVHGARHDGYRRSPVWKLGECRGGYEGRAPPRRKSGPMVQRRDGYRRSPVWRVLGILKKSISADRGLEIPYANCVYSAQIERAGHGPLEEIKNDGTKPIFAEMSQKMAKHPSKRSQYEPNSQPFPAIWG